MRSGGAARRRQEREQEPPPDPVAESVAEIGRVVAGSDATRRKMERHERAMRAEVGRLGQLAAECPNAEQLALAVNRASDRLALVAVELISDAAHNAEAREALERCAAAVELNAASASFTEAMRAAAFEAGRQAGIAEEQARQGRPRAAGGRHAARSRHLKVAGSIAAGSAVAASLVAPAVIAAQDSAAVHHWSPGRVSVRLHAGPADSAVLVPPPSPFPSPRPSAAAASARPAPAVTPSPSVPLPPPAPSASPSAPPPAALSVPRFLDLGDSIRGTLPLTAGPGAVTWTATATDGITLSSYGGVMLAGQQVELQVTDAPAGGGWIYISAGTQTFTVHVTSGLGPVLS